MLRLGIDNAHHGAVCFSACMVLLENGHWNDLKAKLFKTLSVCWKQRLILHSDENLDESSKLIQNIRCSQRSLILMLKYFQTLFHAGKDDTYDADTVYQLLNKESCLIEERALEEASTILIDILQEKNLWNQIVIDKRRTSMSMRDF